MSFLYGIQNRFIWVGQKRNGGIFKPVQCEINKVDDKSIYKVFKTDNPQGKYYIFFHGNADQIGRVGPSIGNEFTKRGHNLIAIEYPGYGLAEGNPSQKSVYETSEKVLQHLMKEIEPSNVILMGHSIGCATALEMSRRGYGSKLILISPFLSIEHMISVVSPILSSFLKKIPFLVRDKLNNMEVAPFITIPTTIFHGTIDEIIPYEQGMALSKLFRSGLGNFIEVEGARHNDILIKIMDDIIKV